MMWRDLDVLRDSDAISDSLKRPGNSVSIEYRLFYKIPAAHQVLCTSGNAKRTLSGKQSWRFEKQKLHTSEAILWVLQ